MKNLIISIALIATSTMFSKDIPATKWNNDGTHKVLTFKKGDNVIIKQNSKAIAYVNSGTITAITGNGFVKINGYFVRASDILTIVNTVYNQKKQ